MTIETERNGDVLILRISGRLDTDTAPRLQEALEGSLENVKDLQIDAAGLEYVTSAGLRVLLAVMKTMKARGGSLTAYNVNDAVMEVFQITGFKRYMDIR